MFIKINFDQRYIVAKTDSSITLQVPFYGAFAQFCAIFVAKKASKIEDTEKEKGKWRYLFVGVNGGVSID
jgi:hypothetical protein